MQPLPPHLPAPYVVLERSVDESGYVAVAANYYWVPGAGRPSSRLVTIRRYWRIGAGHGGEDSGAGDGGRGRVEVLRRRR